MILTYFSPPIRLILAPQHFIVVQPPNLHNFAAISLFLAFQSLFDFGPHFLFRISDNGLTIHTNTVEGLWSQLKDLIKRAKGLSAGNADKMDKARIVLLESYIAEGIYRYNNRLALLATFWSDVTRIYPF